MTVAGELAEFLTRMRPADFPPQAVDHAAMLTASTLASAALGAGIESAVIIRDLAREHGGKPEWKRDSLGRVPHAKKGSSRAAPPLAPSSSENGYSAASPGGSAGGTTET
jgi:hypothetical protein